MASFRAPFYFITFGLIPYRQSFCTLLYYSAAGGRRARPGGGLPPPVPAQTRGSLRAVVECAGVCITRMQPPQVSLQLDTDLCLSPQACALQTAGLAIPHVQCKNAFPQIAIRPESIIYKNRFLGHVDDYVGALPPPAFASA